VSVAVAVEAAVRLEAVDLRHMYSPRRGLETLSFAVGAPGAIAVVGPNGSGKSTLLKIIAGLLRPSGGTLAFTVAGREIPPAARRRSIGFASPELTFYDEMTVAENLAFAGEALGLDRQAERVTEALERVGLESRADDRVPALSSGMKQRLRIAFALLAHAPVLLLDEPGSHLDEEGRRVVARVVQEQRRDALVLIATNDEREWKLAERQIELRGRGLGRPA
jgi:ABC-type multidrug transport system ATPase subunit